jgi:hypothetical protein
LLFCGIRDTAKQQKRPTLPNYLNSFFSVFNLDRAFFRYNPGMKPRFPLLALIFLVMLSACVLLDKPVETVSNPPIQPVEPTQSKISAVVVPSLVVIPTATPNATGPIQDPPTPVSVLAPTIARRASSTPLPTATLLILSTEVPGSSAGAYAPHTGEKRLPEQWKSWPVIPVVSQRAREIYKRGLARGTNPMSFSKIGDCQSIRQYFLGYLDDGDQYARLGDKYYANLKGVLEQFRNSYTRVSMSVRTGFNVASVLSAINSDPQICKTGETPLECEFRVWNPSIVIISMETWTQGRPTAAYEVYLRKIVSFVISHDVVPILATKADNLEGDHSINRIIAQVAYDYDIPLWNFWAAADPLPNHGLMEDGFHLTNGPSIYNEEGLLFAWNVRNLTALQTIDRVWREVAFKK